jgi:hypothetical protein
MLIDFFDAPTLLYKFILLIQILRHPDINTKNINNFLNFSYRCNLTNIQPLEVNPEKNK